MRLSSERLYFSRRRQRFASRHRASWHRLIVAVAIALLFVTSSSVGRAQEQPKPPSALTETAPTKPVSTAAPSAPAEPISEKASTEPSEPTAPAPTGPTVAPVAEPVLAPAPSKPASAPLLAVEPKPAEVQPQAIQATTISKSSEKPLIYGVGLDLGVSGILPDTGLLLTLRPIRWIHVQLGGGYNVISYAIRGGVTWLGPEWLPLSLTAEGGHYFDGDANKAVRWFSGQNDDIASLKKVGYDYVNALVGMTYQGRRFSFYVRGGVTWMRTTVNDFQQTVTRATNLDVEVSDPKITYRGPAVKFGMIVFL